MRVLHIFWREYWGNITRRSYLIFTFGFPLFMVAVPIIFGVALGMALRLALPRTDPRPIGLIDQPHLFPAGEDFPANPVETILFSDAQAAKTALSEGRIQAYYDIQPDYWTSGKIIAAYQ